MISRISAIPGQWYLDKESGAVFQVVGVDADDRSIELQYSDGSIEETSIRDWTERPVETCEQPEDWVGPFDDLEADDIGLPEADAGPHGAEMPLEQALLDLEARRALPVGNAED